jgi:hypothetical protein
MQAFGTIGEVLEMKHIFGILKLNTWFFMIICCLPLLSCGIFDSDKSFSGGSGTVENPYQVSNIKEFQQIAKYENLDKHFIQVNDIDASSSAEFNDGKGFLPIGSIGNPFTGSYNGNGHTIRDVIFNFTVTNIGLFGYVKAGTIENVQLIQSDHPNCNVEKISPNGILLTNTAQKADNIIIIIDDIDTAGLLVGYNDQGGVIRNSVVVGRIGIERNHVGGLVGYNAGLIDNSYANVRLSSPGYSGGLVGGNTGTISNSGTEACISTPSTVGGLSAYNTFEIFNSYSIGSISGISAGGLVAYNLFGTIDASFSSTEIIGFGRRYGGLVAINLAEIKNSYSSSTLDVESVQSNYIGGIAGVNGERSDISHSYFVGKLESESDLNANIGGVTGLNEGSIESSYWDVTATGINSGTGEGNEEGTTGLSTGQMTGPAAEQNMPEFNWVNIWRTTEDGYPVLRWEEE